jgi:type I restriction enzyme S subunit
VPGVDRKDLFQIVVAVPPVDEQAEIVRAIETGSQQLNDVISTAKREMSFVQEYRTRLIADVVTGKLDVRAAAAKLPDEAEEMVTLDIAEELEGAEDTTDDVTPDDETEEAE